MNWMKYRYLYFAFSLLIIIPGVFSLLRFGLQLSIEFTGGSVIELSNISLPPEEITSRLAEFNPLSLETEANQVKINFPPISQTQADQIIKTLSSPDSQPQLVNFQTIGPILGQETIKKTLIGIILAASLILIYIARVFKEIRYGVCAVIAMFHDSLILLGSFSLLGHFFNLQTDLLFVTAVLTTLSFSVHDTIVVYDRIRELTRLHPNKDLETLANQAATETMVRSINNSLTIILMLLALVLMGGQTTKNFALALLIGTISGTYSSPFTATPLLVTWDRFRRRQRTSA